MLVLALLVALSGLVMPGLLVRVAGSTLESVKTRLESAAALCRAEAQRRGVPMEFAAHRVGGRLTIVGQPAASDSDAGGGGEDELMELPPGYSITESAPGGDGLAASKPVPGSGSQIGMARDQNPRRAQPAPADAVDDVVIAVYLPDGSAGAPGARFLVVGETALEVHVARWTGFLILSEPAQPEEDGFPDDDAGTSGPDASLDGEADGGAGIKPRAGAPVRKGAPQ